MRGPAMPQRGMRFGESRSVATASGSGTASGFASSDEVAGGLGDAAVRVRGETRAGASFSSTRTPGGTSPTLPGTFAITTSSSTCGDERRERRAQVGRVAVRHDDGRDARHGASTSR